MLLQISDHPEREHSHGQFHAGAVAHHPRLCHSQLLQCHVRIHAGCSIALLKRSGLTIPRLNLQAPFYPREAAKKGLEVYAFGLVFGTFEVR